MMTSLHGFGGPSLAAFAFLLLPVGLIASCGEPGDDFDSEASCAAYCTKMFDCRDQIPTEEETDACIGGCRNDIEDNCGNDKQADANSKIEECVDLSCEDFASCMVFEDAPECFDFVDL